MPTRKQRRRQQKARRHEYEYVYVDDEGNEVEVDADEVPGAKDGDRSDGRPRRSDSRRPEPRRGSRRTIEPPSWRRAGRRALILGPILVIAMMMLNRGVSVAQQVMPAIVMIAFFIPFSYFTDSLAYRMYRKRVEGRDAAKKRERG